MKLSLNQNWFKTFFLMLVSVIIMGMGVSLLKITNFGTDPCSAMNYGISAKIGLSFGTYQLLFNLFFFLFVIIFDRKLIGTGTLGNMILVGYSADFFSWFFSEVCQIPTDLNLTIRICILFPSLIIFVIAAACYMQSGHGMAPYDGFPFLLTNMLQKKTGKQNLFKYIRLGLDATATIIAFLVGGEVGITTVLMVFMLAPMVDYVGKLFDKFKAKNKAE